MAGLLAAPAAEACGGFFCSRVPIDQAGERIVFGVRDNTVEAHIQIQYQGAAEEFSWVVPMPALPSLSVGSPLIFSYLDARTQPRFTLDWQNSCKDGGRGGIDLANGDSSGPPLESAPTNGGVTVISREEVGPYDAAILQAEASEELRTWLVDNGYDLTPQGAEALEPYVGRGNYFVALKLQQNKQVGDLRPIIVRFQGTRPCIPIKLTAIAARPDMPITAYVLSDKRAIPLNYRHVLINLSRIDWLRFGSNYSQVATAAVDEAGGRAFLTEFAGAAAPFAQGFESFLPNYNTELLAGISHPVDFSAELLRQGFARDPSTQGLLRKYIPIPASLVQQGVTEQQFYNMIFNYRAAIDSDPNRPPFDAAGFAQELETTVVKPGQDSLALLKAHPYLTRLYTTMSAEEMTVDPDFDFNSDAPDVPNLYTAKAYVESCEEDWSQRKIRIELPDGRYYNTRFNAGPITQGPNSLRIEQWAEVGPAAIIQNNRALVDKALEDVDGGVLNSGCACSSAEAGSAALLSLLIAAWGARRRRKA
jgi:MYXO-CTERM domain-containing protein